MRALLALLICVVALCGIARADVLAPRPFTEEFARALKTALPSAVVTVTGDLQLKITDARGGDTTMFLTNPYRDYQLDPQRFSHLVQAFAAALSQSRSAPAQFDRSRIVPVIKDRQWLADLHKTLKARGAEQEHLSESFNDELIIVYAQDDPSRMRYLTTKEEIGVDRQELRALAVANLLRILPKIEMQSDGDVSLITAGGDYEPSLLLIDDIWSSGQIKVNGDVVVAVPARDVLLVTGSRDRSGLKRIRELAAKFAAQGPHRLIDTLFVYRDGRFSKFEAK